MEVFSWIDSRTLLGCQCILIAVFAAMLLGMRYVNPGLAGIRSIIAGFVFGLPVAIIATAGSAVPFTTAALAGGALTLLSCLFLCRGILQFCHGKNLPLQLRTNVLPRRGASPADYFPILCGLCSITMLAILYFTQVHFNRRACMVAITATLALTRGLMAWSLLRCAGRRIQMRAFGISMAIFAALTAVQAVHRPFLAVGDRLAQSSGYKLSLFVTVVFFCVQGIFYLLMFAGDVTESEHEDAQHDHLLGTLNRRGVEAALTAEIARTRRTRAPFALMLIDIDHFKGVNDRFGHLAGDSSLKLIARGISATVRAYDMLGRYGGDEFLVVLPATDCQEALLTAARVREAVLAETAGFAAGPMTLSIGITACSGGEDMLDIVSRADTALYEAKHAGRDCARIRVLDLGESGVATLAAPPSALPREAETV